MAFNELFAASPLADRAVLWIALGAPHTAAFGLYPEEYERRVIAFFDGWLVMSPSAVPAAVELPVAAVQRGLSTGSRCSSTR